MSTSEEKASDPTTTTATTTVAAPDAKISADDGRQYWQGIDADDNGMLGGYSKISRVDLRGSRGFLAKLGLGRVKGEKAVKRALEGGAGIGRITQGLLLDVAEVVDVVEPIAKFTAPLAGLEGVGRIFNVGLEEWRPADDESDVRYDLVWNQWCLGHLTDQQLEEYLRRCGSVLSVGEDGRTRGLIAVKENMSTTGEDVFDELDSSVTRQDEKFRAIFEKAGLRIIKTEVQHGFPGELYPVRMYALKPKDT
ncbi:Uu.00g005370.m01.CDS01 [Anthostomella pinea]|uniref:Alpha N-terminal protein methyltransferase 1 n=1 Tax=Anthostomella pinea TaxID=933095 RepID=A0AAI8YIX1_9PEZI|nr:Uu.00g005370.m01.CDS01 [Anthostomella pinea]